MKKNIFKPQELCEKARENKLTSIEPLIYASYFYVTSNLIFYKNTVEKEKKKKALDFFSVGRITKFKDIRQLAQEAIASNL